MLSAPNGTVESSMARASFSFWDRQGIDGTFVAITCFDNDVLAAAGEARYTIQQSRLPAFLASNRHVLFLTDDVALTYRRLQKQMPRDDASRAILPNLVKAQRLIDPELWSHSLIAQYGCQNPLGLVERVAESTGLDRLVGMGRALMEAQQQFERHAPTRRGAQARRFCNGSAIEGKIALCGNPFRASLDAESQSELRELLQRQQSDAAKIINTTTELRRCYYPAGGEVSLRKGLPKYDGKRLREWLRRQAEGLQVSEAHPLCLPSTFPGDLGLLARASPELQAWVDYDKACRALLHLGALSAGLVELESQSLPRAKLAPGSAGLVGHNRLKPPAEQRFLVIRFPDLIIRCLVAVCRQHALDKNECFAQAETGNLVPVLCDRLGLDVAHGILATSTNAPGQFIHALIHGAGLHWSNRLIRTVIGGVAGASLSETETSKLATKLREVVPGLDRYSTAPFRDFLRNHGATSNLEQKELAGRLPLFYRAVNTMNLESFDQACAGFLDQTTRDRMAVQLAPSLINIHMALRARRAAPTGRERDACELSEHTAEYLDAADDVLKQIAYEIAVAQDWPLVIHEETIVAAVSTTEPIQEKFVKKIAAAVGNDLLGMPLYCEVASSDSI